jgi:hypothetical protein
MSLAMSCVRRYVGTSTSARASQSLGEPYEFTSEYSPTYDYLSSQEPCWEVEVPVPARRVRISVEGMGREPSWLRAVVESVAELLSLAPDWDSYGAAQVSLRAAQSAVQLLLRFSNENGIEPPALVPTSRGGLQLEWQRTRRIVEVEITAQGSAVLFVADIQRGEESEVVLTQSLDPLRRALAHD